MSKMLKIPNLAGVPSVGEMALDCFWNGAACDMKVAVALLCERTGFSPSRARKVIEETILTPVGQVIN